MTHITKPAADAFAVAHKARNATLAERLRQSADWLRNASPAEREAMHKAQRESFARAMAPCEHGVADWEDCPDCLATLRAKQAEMNDDARQNN